MKDRGAQKTVERAVIEEVRSALAPLVATSSLEGPAGRDPLHLAELLLDHAVEMAPRRLTELLGKLRGGPLFELAEREIERRFLFLDPGQVARRTVARMVVETLCERRVRPYEEFERRMLSAALEELRSDPSLIRWQGDAVSPLEESMMGAMAGYFNRLDDDPRRVIWLSEIGELAPGEIAERTGLPLERVEFWVSHLREEAERQSLLQLEVREVQHEAREAAGDASHGSGEPDDAWERAASREVEAARRIFDARDFLDELPDRLAEFQREGAGTMDLVQALAESPKARGRAAALALLVRAARIGRAPRPVAARAHQLRRPLEEAHKHFRETLARLVLACGIHEFNRATRARGVAFETQSVAWPDPSRGNAIKAARSLGMALDVPDLALVGELASISIPEEDEKAVASARAMFTICRQLSSNHEETNACLTSLAELDGTVVTSREWAEQLGQIGNPYTMSTVLWCLAWSLSAEGEHRNAVAAIERALALRPDYEPLRFDLMVILVSAGDLDPACRVAEDCLSSKVQASAELGAWLSTAIFKLRVPFPQSERWRSFLSRLSPRTRLILQEASQ